MKKNKQNKLYNCLGATILGILFIINGGAGILFSIPMFIYAMIKGIHYIENQENNNEKQQQ